jgi:enoyl-CoA hydratase/carnithine racemase
MSDQDCEVRAGGDIIFRVDDGAAILQLNRPAKRNALSQAMWEAIRAALAEAADRPDVRAFVFTGLPGVFLVELMGSGRASHLLFTAGRIDAARAADMPTLLAIRDTIRQVR